MFREMVDEDLEYARSMLLRINHSAADIFYRSYRAGRVSKKFILEQEYNHGVFTVVEGDTFYSFQLSFENDVSDYEVIKFIEEELNYIVSVQENKDIYVNFNAYNEALVNYFMEYGLVRDALGFEFYITTDSDKVNRLKDFTLRPDISAKNYEEEHSLKYLKLLDEAFRKQQIACKEEQDIFSKNHEGNKAWLKGMKENDFKTFWVNDDLVGLYIVNENYIDFIAVHPNYERKGYGSDILNYCIKDRIYENHFDNLYLATYYQNRKAQRLYLKNGFKVRGFYCENTYRG